jgi:arylsulfatase
MSILEYEPGTEFPGKIGKKIEESTHAWPVPKRAESEVPNVLFYV